MTIEIRVTDTAGRWLTASAPGKLNLGLAVRGRRPDGYHELRSIFLRIGLLDELRARVDIGAPADALAIEGDPDCPIEGNLVLRAAALARRTLAREAPAVEFRLTKRIPIGAGLGGGSSDAAATLALSIAAWSLVPDAHALGPVAVQLGADVPFFLGASLAALVGGIGERSEPLDRVPEDVGILLVVPAASISTAEAFRAFDAGARLGRASVDSSDAIDSVAGDLRVGMGAVALADSAHRLRDANDLWPAAASLAPELPGLRDRLERALGRPFLLSGSGSTLFALYPSVAEAREALARLRTAEPEIVAQVRLITAVPLHTPPTTIRENDR